MFNFLLQHKKMEECYHMIQMKMWQVVLLIHLYGQK